MLQDIVIGACPGLLAEMLSTTARQLGATRRAHGRRHLTADVGLATWFNTYTLTEDIPRELAQRLSFQSINVNTNMFKERLASDACHAVLHELLAARLTDAPERQVARLRTAFVRALRPDGNARRTNDIAQVAFDYFDDQICTLVGRLEGALPDTAEKLRDRAMGDRIIAILDAIERHEAARAESGGLRPTRRPWSATAATWSRSSAKSRRPTSTSVGAFRSTTSTSRRTSPLSLNQWQIERMLRSLAYWLLTREDATTAVTERQLVEKTTSLLLKRDMEQAEQAEAAASEFVDFCRGRGWVFADVGTTAGCESLYTFAHRTLLEYFAAAYLAAAAETPEALGSGRCRCGRTSRSCSRRGRGGRSTSPAGIRLRCPASPRTLDRRDC